MPLIVFSLHSVSFPVETRCIFYVTDFTGMGVCTVAMADHLARDTSNEILAPSQNKNEMIHIENRKRSKRPEGLQKCRNANEHIIESTTSIRFHKTTVLYVIDQKPQKKAAAKPTTINSTVMLIVDEEPVFDGASAGATSLPSVLVEGALAADGDGAPAGELPPRTAI
ncbi:hypothetical protein Cgig2_016734 [Carnegiea gigantea]|uniref:Uncharacterized protein n=1 Tax=Carnegiea gigantea TaxID=171969 RepID=A0A9Q1KZ04_9CARY|nr:hypothetical protein Cgig2_016734 [Carnegiea gigantea]